MASLSPCTPALPPAPAPGGAPPPPRPTAWLSDAVPLCLLPGPQPVSAETQADLEWRAAWDQKTQQRELDSHLLIAARLGDAPAVERLAEAGAAVDAKTEGDHGKLGDPALVLAARGGHTAAVAVLLRRGAAVDAATPGGTTALMAAAQHGHADTAASLLEGGGLGGAALEAQSSIGSTALIYAAAHGHAECVRLLAESGADRSHADEDGTALENAELGKAAPQPAVSPRQVVQVARVGAQRGMRRWWRCSGRCCCWTSSSSPRAHHPISPSTSRHDIDMVGFGSARVLPGRVRATWLGWSTCSRKARTAACASATRGATHSTGLRSGGTWRWQRCCGRRIGKRSCRCRRRGRRRKSRWREGSRRKASDTVLELGLPS